MTFTYNFVILWPWIRGKCASLGVCRNCQLCGLIPKRCYCFTECNIPILELSSSQLIANQGIQIYNSTMTDGCRTVSISATRHWCGLDSSPFELAHLNYRSIFHDFDSYMKPRGQWYYKNVEKPIFHQIPPVCLIGGHFSTNSRM